MCMFVPAGVDTPDVPEEVSERIQGQKHQCKAVTIDGLYILYIYITWSYHTLSPWT